MVAEQKMTASKLRQLFSDSELPGKPLMTLLNYFSLASLTLQALDYFFRIM